MPSSKQGWVVPKGLGSDIIFVTNLKCEMRILYRSKVLGKNTKYFFIIFITNEFDRSCITDFAYSA